MKVLITGGSGLIGTELTKLLKSREIEVVWLSRTPGIKNGITTYAWDYKKNFIDHAAFESVTHIVHLAGAGVFDKRWSSAYKKEIYDSRIRTTQLLVKATADINSIQAFICGTAIGVYGNSMNEVLLNENDSAGADFLARVTKDWELASKPLEERNIRTVKIRTGIVLAKQTGALPEMIKPIKLGIGSPLASGKQIISWIHIEDLCEIFTRAIIDPTIFGIFNGVAPHPVSNATFTKAAADILGKRLLFPNVPKFVMNMVLGKEKAASVVEGIAASASKIQKQGFVFKYPNIKEALTDLLLL
jgi:uncharacterized protein (TIGR01777 family)